jgi:hypothetical protein
MITYVVVLFFCNKGHPGSVFADERKGSNSLLFTAASKELEQLIQKGGNT